MCRKKVWIVTILACRTAGQENQEPRRSTRQKEPSLLVRELEQQRAEQALAREAKRAEKEAGRALREAMKVFSLR